MNNLKLADLAKMTDDEVYTHLINDYQPQEDVHRYRILVAYESVGSWGCDSSSWFLLQSITNDLYEVTGSHCSCYGFEGQFEPEPTTIEYLKSDRFSFCGGGYDDNEEANKSAVKDWIAKNL